MDRQLHLLESFHAVGSDGNTYKVKGYEHLRRDDSLAPGLDHWLPTGMHEYRLDSGELVEQRADGRLQVLPSAVELSRL
jgi:hypothetical protein